MIEDVAEAFRLGYQSIVDFRRLFLPADNEVAPADYHFTWNDILLHGRGNFAVEAFRESAKSALVIRAHTLYRLVYPSKDYDFIIFCLANQRVASRKLKEIANEYLSNPLLSANLIRVREQSEKAFEVEVLDINSEPITIRIEAHGKGSSSIRGLLWVSTRPKLVILDDCQNHEDALSEITLDNDYDWFLSDVLFLGQSTRIFLIGNNLGAKCLVERVIDGAEELGFDWERVPILNNDGKSNWPSKWSVDDILKERDSFTALGKLDVWYREKMCIAMSPDSQIFKKDWFKYYSSKDVKKQDLSVYITVDLASSEKLDADYRAIAVVGVNSDNNWFVMDIRYGRWDPTRTMDEIFDCVSKYKPLVVGIEKVAYQSVLAHFLEKEMPKRNIFFTIKPLIADKKKTLRISAMQPRFSTGSVWFLEKADFLTELEAELLSFTDKGMKGLHDDLIDALAYMEQIALSPSGNWGSVSSDDLPLAGSL